MKIILFASLLIILLLSCQNKKIEYDENFLEYYQIVEKANYLAFKDDTFSADSLYRNAFQKVKTPFYKDLVKAAENISNDNVAVYKYLKRAIKTGLDTSKIIENKSFNNFRASKEWEKLVRKYDSIRKQFKENLDRELRNEISCMFDMDQYIRNNLNDTELTMDEVDDRNFELLLHLIESRGFPGRIEIGEDMADKMMIMLHHFNPKMNEKYFYELAQQKMINGQLTPIRNAMFRDYDKIKSGKKQLYGTYHTIYKGQKTLEAVENYENINDLRKKMGLGPIEYQLEINQIVYDPEFDSNKIKY